jgi:DUF1680 family protein
VTGTPDEPWELALRVPAWAEGATLAVDGEPISVGAVDGWWRVNRQWRPGSTIDLVLPLPVRFTGADPRVDAVRAAIAIERGPLVYCLEGVDHLGHRLDDVVVDPTAGAEIVDGAGVLDGVVVLSLTGRLRPRRATGWWPYAARDSSAPTGADAGRVQLTAVPYYTWGNRGAGAMRIWVPTT